MKDRSPVPEVMTMRMNLPNRLTLLRIALVPVFVAFALLGIESGIKACSLVAAAVFAVASLTDMLDGHIARSRNLITDFGKLMDPLADKMLTTAAYVCMVLAGACHPVALILILSREFAVSGIRMLAASSGDRTVVPANVWGKAKTVLMMVGIIAFYSASGFLPGDARVLLASNVLCWICAVLAIVSGITYFVSLKHLLKDM